MKPDICMALRFFECFGAAVLAPLAERGRTEEGLEYEWVAK